MNQFQQQQEAFTWKSDFYSERSSECRSASNPQKALEEFYVSETSMQWSSPTPMFPFKTPSPTLFDRTMIMWRQEESRPRCGWDKRAAQSVQHKAAGPETGHGLQGIYGICKNSWSPTIWRLYQAKQVFWLTLSKFFFLLLGLISTQDQSWQRKFQR